MLALDYCSSREMAYCSLANVSNQYRLMGCDNDTTYYNIIIYKVLAFSDLLAMLIFFNVPLPISEV